MTNFWMTNEFQYKKEIKEAINNLPPQTGKVFTWVIYDQTKAAWETIVVTGVWFQPTKIRIISYVDSPATYSWWIWFSNLSQSCIVMWPSSAVYRTHRDRVARGDQFTEYLELTSMDSDWFTLTQRGWTTIYEEIQYECYN